MSFHYIRIQQNTTIFWTFFFFAVQLVQSSDGDVYNTPPG